MKNFGREVHEAKNVKAKAECGVCHNSTGYLLKADLVAKLMPGA